MSGGLTQGGGPGSSASQALLSAELVGNFRADLSRHVASPEQMAKNNKCNHNQYKKLGTVNKDYILLRYSSSFNLFLVDNNDTEVAHAKNRRAVIEFVDECN